MPLDGSSVKQGEAGEKLQSVKMLAGSSNEQWSALERGGEEKGPERSAVRDFTDLIAN